MWPKNALTERLNIDYPILQAPVGNLSTPTLAAPVRNVGGLGGIGMWGFSAEDARLKSEEIVNRFIKELGVEDEVGGALLDTSTHEAG